jgi:hypothetical protein
MREDSQLLSMDAHDVNGRKLEQSDDVSDPRSNLVKS